MEEIKRPTVFLCRHGATSFNGNSDSESRLKGTKFDLPITDEGRGEAKKTAKFLAAYPIGSLMHSAMLRSEQTADEIEKAVKVESIEQEALDPWDVGYLSGHTKEDAKARIEYYIKNGHKPIPEGESYEEWFSRFENALVQAMRQAEKEPDKAHVRVSHSCGVMAARSIVNGEPHQFYGEGNTEAPGAVMLIEKRGGRWRMKDTDMEGGDVG